MKIVARRKKVIKEEGNIFKTVVLGMHRKGLDAKYIAMELKIPYREVLSYIKG